MGRPVEVCFSWKEAFLPEYNYYAHYHSGREGGSRAGQNTGRTAGDEDVQDGSDPDGVPTQVLLRGHRGGRQAARPRQSQHSVRSVRTGSPG